jgi:hypothetical protein
MKNIFRCRICNFDCYPFAPWGADGLNPSYSICPNCNAEFGYEDSSDAGIKNYREMHLTEPKNNEKQDYWTKPVTTGTIKRAQ